MSIAIALAAVMATWGNKAIERYRAMAVATRLVTYLSLACEHCCLRGGNDGIHKEAKQYIAMFKEAKQYIAMHRSSGHTYVQVWAMARSVNDLGLRRAILSRLSTRFSKNNPLHHALVTESMCL